MIGGGEQAVDGSGRQPLPAIGSTDEVVGLEKAQVSGGPEVTRRHRSEGFAAMGIQPFRLKARGTRPVVSMVFMHCSHPAAAGSPAANKQGGCGVAGGPRSAQTGVSSRLTSGTGRYRILPREDRTPYKKYLPQPGAAMSDTSRLSDDTHHRLARGLERLARGDLHARDELIGIAAERMREIAQRMLRTFPTVRRWDETDDVVQNAALRLYRALATVTPQDARGFVGLAAVQVRRELLDLARKHAGPESQAAHHETAVLRADGREVAKVDLAEDNADPLERIATWTRLHEAAGHLPEEERELFAMVWYLGLKQEEIAALVGISVRTVKRRWESAKRLLAQAVRGEDLA